jgi:hypothetical protein
LIVCRVEKGSAVNSRLRLLLSFFSVVAVCTTAYVAYVRTSVNVQLREANEAVAGAMHAAEQARVKAREVDALLNEESFKNERAKLTASGREASRMFAEAAASLRAAVDKIGGAIETADTEAGRTYYRMKRDSLLKRAETGEAAHDGYAVVADESITDLATLRARMEPHAVRAEAARIEAKRLAAEAESFREKHQGGF